MYTSPPTEAEMAAAGLTIEDFCDEATEVWPENESVYFLFHALATQWRTGAVGCTGLDHNVLFHRLDRMNLDPEEYDQLDRDIRVMETEALERMREKTQS